MYIFVILLLRLILLGMVLNNFLKTLKDKNSDLFFEINDIRIDAEYNEN